MVVQRKEGGTEPRRLIQEVIVSGAHKDVIAEKSLGNFFRLRQRCGFSASTTTVTRARMKQSQKMAPQNARRVT